MPIQDTVVTSSYGSQSFVDRYGQQASQSFDLPGSFGTQVTAILTAIGNSSNAAVVDQVGGAKARAFPPYTAFDEAEQSVRSVLVLRFQNTASPATVPVKYIEIPAFDASLLLPGQPFADVANTQIAAIISNMDTAGWTYLGSFVSTRKGKVRKQVVVAGLVEPGAGELPSGLPDTLPDAGIQDEEDLEP